MSHKKEQLAASLKRVLSQQLTQGLADPRVRGMITVTEVQVTPDLSTAIIKVSVMPEEHAELTLHALRHAARHLQIEASKSIRVRRMPRLDFRLDESLKTQARILAAIREAMEEQSQPSSPDESGGSSEDQAS